ncbi:MAG: hypothetical protein ABH870_03370 [bacterium]
MSIEPLIFKKEVEIIVSPQAQKVLQHTGYTAEEFLEWALNVRRISFGGANIIEFLEKMEVKDGSSPS